VPPVETHQFSPGTTAISRHDSAEMRERAPVVGTVANRNPQKGLEYLLSAFEIVRKSYPSARLRIRGAVSPAHHEYDARLKRQAAVLGLGSDAISEIAPASDVPGTLSEYDVFVLSSVPRSEGLPTVLLEAMAMGVPVVATRVGGVAEIISHGVNGLLVQPCAPRALAGAICQLLGNPDLRRRFASAGRTFVATRCSVSECARIHADAYQRALDRSRVGGRI